ncbi:glutamate synthase subunit beta [Haloarcula sp. JP-L23]|uniref:glutamate synthase subunit beta n=1 Tax=Haloarcula sp. JP-L23 TaxID=2716717 RepID=UPI00140ED8BD|nr:glutamate synthase subunit beta [Haloarcula sp. JP-L23]
MTEPHPNGWRDHDRADIEKRDPAARVEDFDEIWQETWDAETLREQGERCMDCGVPTCMSGCPIGNVVPEWNDLVYRDDWRRALDRLHETNNFPEFTGYTCPAPCESACVLAYNDDPVTIKSIERAIVDVGWAEGWITPEPPDERTEYHVGVVGSGPAGLTAAQQLARVGHRVTVYERDDALGGLMRYGIPDFKFRKSRIDRRIDQLRAEGVTFETDTEVGGDVPADALVENHDAVCLAVGAQRQRDIDLPGRDLDGIYLAMDYLRQTNREQAGDDVERIPIEGRDVVVLGGGDTGADCVATAHRHGASQVVQIGIREQPPEERPPNNPWPEQPKTYHKTYAQEEGGSEAFGVDTQAFVDTDGDGHVDCLDAERVEWTYDEDGARAEKTVVDPSLEIPADAVFVAIGFTGPTNNPFADLGVTRGADGTFETDERKMTAVDGVFAAGDATRGQSLVVWAIGEGRDAARHVDAYLTGETDLPPSLETDNPSLL